ncbi:hypothetical protein [Leptolyngbya sp. FACHB-261]|uniref:hypothetical protein n=1 Tax=Leptolyngbya sp. FACHB-261 TaxID=2692806 RepID=UPI00168A2B67|nr:hypothetical protein [Leptolyngbya sp. FACHB-261]MBD2101459.1 hypothetical protein [Leptolyngbya sp. FACHB-261]
MSDHDAELLTLLAELSFWLADFVEASTTITEALPGQIDGRPTGIPRSKLVKAQLRLEEASRHLTEIRGEIDRILQQRSSLVTMCGCCH